MALTVGEANAVNVLLRYITGEEHDGEPVPTGGTALYAAELLASYAYQRLGSGWHPEELAAVWPNDDEESHA